MTNHTACAHELIAMRKHCELTQHGMANQLGMSLRAYQALEAGESQVRPIHILAAERVSLTQAIQKKNIEICLPFMRRDALDLVKLIRGE